MDRAQLQAILALDLEERLEFVRLIWDSIAEDPGAVLPTAAERAEIDRRIEEDDADPQDVVTWQQAKDLILRAR